MEFKKYGISTYTKNFFKNKFGINNKVHVNLSIENKFKSSFDSFSNSIQTERDLFIDTYENIEFLKSINCYKGLRHKNNYPVRGQRTHTNATKKIVKSKNFF